MLSFFDYNPIAVFIYYFCVVMLCVFCMNPITALISLIGAVSFMLVGRLKNKKSFHLFAIFTFIVIILLNPIFSHNGKTVLLVINNAPITLEAAFYGAVTGLMLLSSVYWLKTFSVLMTTDRLLYIFGKISPKVALILSMTLRMLPLFAAQSQKTDHAQKGMGLYKDETFLNRFKGKARVFSVMLTWATENAVVTADSMAARGYSGEKRTSFSIFRFTFSDAVFTALSVLLCLPPIIASASGKLEFVFYPTVISPKNSALTVIAYICYAVLCIIPTAAEAGDRLKWKYFRSGI